MRLLFLDSDPGAAGKLDETALRALYRHPQPTTRPLWIRSNFVTSLDGSIQGPDGRAGSINTPSDQHVFALHRAHADVILVGAQTVRAEHYRAVDLAPWQRELRAQEGLSTFPVLAVVSRSLDLDPGMVTSGDEDGGPVVVLTTSGRSDAELARLTDAGIDVVQLPGGSGVDLDAVASHLAAAGLVRVLCEGGPRLHGDLLAAGLVDEMSLTLAPVVVGQGSRTTAGGPLSGGGFALRSVLHADDGALFLSYRRGQAGSPQTAGLL